MDQKRPQKCSQNDLKMTTQNTPETPPEGPHQRALCRACREGGPEGKTLIKQRKTPYSGTCVARRTESAMLVRYISAWARLLLSTMLRRGLLRVFACFSCYVPCLLACLLACLLTGFSSITIITNFIIITNVISIITIIVTITITIINH